MKKLFAVILAVTMLFCSSFVTAGAFSLFPRYEIAYGETVEVEIPDSDIFPYVMVSFTPEESGYYALRSYAEEENDPYCELYAGWNAEHLYSSDDDGYGLNFCMEYYYEAGQLYYFVLSDYEGAAKWNVSLGCAHSYVDGFCEYCSEECPHKPVSGLMGMCKCGKVFSGIDVKEGASLELTFGEEYEKVLKFTPETDGAYIIYSSSEAEGADPAADVFDEGYYYLASGDDEDGLNFTVMNEFEAGKTYYIVIYNYSDFDYKFEVTLEKAAHDVSDGTTHELIYVPAEYPTCAQTGYGEGLYCEECEEYIFGHEEIPMAGHWDWNRDGYCDLCDAEMELPECEHICHNQSHFLSFIWKIVNFFNKLLGNNPFCQCGVYHF